MQSCLSERLSRRLLISAPLLLLAAGLGVEPSVATTKREVDDIIAADRAFAESAIGENTDHFASYMTDDYVLLELEPGTDKAPSHWVSKSKKEWVAAVRNSTQRYSAVGVHNQTVYLQGTIATVSGEYSQTATKEGKDFSSSGLYVETWVKRKSRWLILSSVFP